MESPENSSSVLSQPASESDLESVSKSDADPLSLGQLELKKKIQDEDRDLSNELLNRILSDKSLDASQTVDENKSKENSRNFDSRDSDDFQVRNTPERVDLQSEYAPKPPLDVQNAWNSITVDENKSKENSRNFDSRDSNDFQVRNTPERVDLQSEEALKLPLDVQNAGNSISDLNGFEALSSKTLSEMPVKEYRCPEEEWSADEDSSSSSSDSSDSESFFEAMREGPAPKRIMPIKTKGELDLDDLPLIEDLVISVETEEMEQIGKVYAIVDKLVVVRAFKGLKPLDLDSVLFLSHDNPLGRIFDVFGPVVEPFYSIRFNNDEHIKEKRVTVDAAVYYAPKKDEITSYVFVDQLQNQKGSDASWKDNNEPPEQFLDYSDDEQERAARRKRADRNRNQNINNSSQVTTKRPHLDDDSSDKSTYIPPPQPAVSRQNTMHRRPNPFMSPLPLVSTPQPFLRSPSPFYLPYNANMPFRSPLPFQPQGALPMQGGPALMFRAHQPPVFGQVSFLSPMSPAMHPSTAFPPPVLTTVPTLVPSHPITLPNNYFVQRFSPSLSPGPVSPDPWLPNQAPYQQTHSLPPNAPLTVQIPPSSPSLPMQHVNGGGIPSFGPVYNQQQQQRTFPNGVQHSPFY